MSSTERGMSWNRAENRSRNIDEQDRLLRGFPTLFADLPPLGQAKVLEKIKELKNDLNGTPEEFAAGLRAIHNEVKTLGALYGSVEMVAKDSTKRGAELTQAFKTQIEEIETSIN